MYSSRQRKKNKKKIEFLLESGHYRKLHLLLYVISVSLILFIYSLTIYIFQDSSITTITTIITSLFIGVFLVFKRDHIVKVFSEKLDENKRVRIKEGDKSGLRTTLKRITPKNKKLKLNIKGKTSLKERIEKMKRNVNKNKKGPDYIEIED